MKLSKYRAIDLTIFAFILCFFEVVCMVAKANLKAYFYLSTASTIVLICMIRWNAWSLIHAVFGGVCYALTATYILGDTSGLLTNIIVYGVGNAFVAIMLLYIKIVKKQVIIKGGWGLVFYALLGVLSITVGKSVMAFCCGDALIPSFIRFIAVDSLNFVLAIVILFITNRQQNILVDQAEYFAEVRGR